MSQLCGKSLIGRSMKPRYLRAGSNRLRWVREKVGKKAFSAYWESAAANLAGYPTKHHSPTHHRTARPIYTYQPNQSPTTMQGCANILESLRAIRRPIAKPAWLASMRRKIAPTAPQAQDTARHRHLKPIARLSPSRQHAHYKTPDSASRPHQLRPLPPQ